MSGIYVLIVVLGMTTLKSHPTEVITAEFNSRQTCVDALADINKQAAEQQHVIRLQNCYKK